MMCELLVNTLGGNNMKTLINYLLNKPTRRAAWHGSFYINYFKKS